MIKRAAEMRFEDRQSLRGGIGNIGMTYLVEKEESLGKMNICGILTVNPGCSIGVHPHGPDAELYYMLEGELVCTENGVETVLYAGDSMFVGDGNNHGVENKTDKPAKMLAVVIV